MSLPEKVQQLNREIGSTVERAIADMRQEVSQWLRSSSEELLGRLAELRPAVPDSFVDHKDLEPEVQTAAEGLSAQTRRGSAAELRESLSAIDRARSQADILSSLLREASRYASRSAILLLRGGEVRGWSGQGFGDAEDTVREVNLGPPHDGSWSHAFGGQGPARLSAAECALLCSRLESPIPNEGILVPLVLRDRVAAALYADSTDGTPLTSEALQILCYTAALAIESLPFRDRTETPTLANVEGEATEAPLGAQTAAIAGIATIPEPEPTPESEPATQPWTPQVEPAEEPAAEVLSEVEVEVEAEPEPAGIPEAMPWAAVEEPEPYTVDSLDETAAESSTGWGEPAVEDIEEASTPTQKVDLRGLGVAEEAEPSAMEEEPSGMEAVSEAANPQATVLLQRSTLREAMAPPPAVTMPEVAEERPMPPMPPPTPIRPMPPIPPPSAEPPPPAAPGTPEVRPPSDVQGPGWAFASTRQPVSPGEEALHEEARRLARLLVSEIKLYNEEQVEEGRRKRDVYERLKEDIDRSRQMYEERVEPRILKTTDYFYQELVRILAAGDAKALGI